MLTSITLISFCTKYALNCHNFSNIPFESKIKQDYNWNKIAQDTYFAYEKAICQTVAEKQARQIAQENAKKANKAKNTEKEITNLLNFKKRHAYA